MNQQFTPPMNNMNVSEKIVGVKPCRIFVRELWLGGIPEKIESKLIAFLPVLCSLSFELLLVKFQLTENNTHCC